MNKLRGVILPKKWIEFDEIKDNKIEQLEKYIEVREQEIEELNNRINEVIDILEKDENKEPIEVILNNVGKALDILKGE